MGNGQVDVPQLPVWTCLAVIIAKAVIPGFPAEKAGIQGGDEIVAIDGTRIIHWYQMADIIHAHPNEELRITILRDGQEIEKRITPQL